MAKRRGFQFFPPAPGDSTVPAYLPEYLKQKPTGHVLSAHRLALLISPCCTRRLRVRLFMNCTGWKHEPLARCPGCRRFWHVKLALSSVGIAKRATLALTPTQRRRKHLKK